MIIRWHHRLLSRQLKVTNTSVSYLRVNQPSALLKNQRRWRSTTNDGKNAVVGLTTNEHTFSSASEEKATTEENPPQLSPMTPLLKELIERIKLRGAITVHDYMAACLTHPIHGYYSTQEALGKLGDFVTAPEISQTFGEMIGVWCVAMWQKMGEPERIRIVEVGGGKGTLMKDVLRTCSNFAKFSQSLNGITMVDASSRMRGLQRQALTGVPPGLESVDECEISFPFQSTSTTRNPQRKVKVNWLRNVNEIKSEEPVLIIAQELFDALPIHQFQFADGRWCERLVDIAEEIDKVPPDLHNLKHHLRFVLSRGPTPAAKVLLKGMVLQSVEEGTQIEVGSTAAAVAQDMAVIISKCKGAALIVDYGENHPIAESLRGIKDHAFVHPLREPGLVDLSVDVDFSFLTRSVREGLKSLGIRPANVVGPITQAEFLRNMGIEHRVAALIRSKEGNEDEQLKVFLGYKRLVEDMGTSYKVMVLTTLEDSPGFKSP